MGRNGNAERLAFIQKHEFLGMGYTPFDFLASHVSRYFFDNGAFRSYMKKIPFDEAAFKRTYQKFQGADFLVIPDIVAGGLESLKFSIDWRNRLPDNYNWYLAVQDGMKPSDIPKDLLKRIKGIFVGGTMDWKFISGADWVKFAHKNGLKCHIGRIGTLKGLMWAERIGADSVDSTSYAKNDQNWQDLQDWVNGTRSVITVTAKRCMGQCQ